MRFFYALWLILSLTACGTEPATTAEPVAAETYGETINRQDNEPEPLVVEYRKDGERLALALEDTKDLPACELDNEKQLAYIKRTEQFFECSDEEWNEVPIKGKSGDSGEQGATGPQGPSGPKGDAGQPATANQWFDPMAENTWLVGAAVSQAPIILGTAVCSGSYRLASSAELQAAILHGLSIASGSFGGSTTFWSSDTIADVNGDPIPVFVKANGQSQVSDGQTHGVACVAEEIAE